MKPFYLLLALTAFACPLFAQQTQPPIIEWQKSLGGSGIDQASSIIQTSDHGYLVVGSSFSNDGQVTGHHGTTDFSDAWVVKLDQNGNLQWQQSYGGSRHDRFKHVIETGNGEFICVGSTQSTDGDITGLHMHDTTHAYDVWAVRISKTGAILWSKVFGGTDDDNAQVIRRGIDGGYIIGGDAYSTDGDATGNHGYSDVWVVKIDEQGVLQWQHSYGNPNGQYTNSITTLSDGNYVISGYQVYKGYPALLPGIAMYSLYMNLQIKIDPQGNVIWEQYPNFPERIPGISHYFSSIFEQPNSELLAIGKYTESVIYDHPFLRIYKLDAVTGNQKSGGGFIPGDFGYRYVSSDKGSLSPDAIQRLSDSSIISCQSTWTYDSSSTNASITRIRNQNDTFRYVFTRNFGGTGSEYFAGMTVVSDDIYVTAGTSNSNNGHVSGNHGNYDFWVVRFVAMNKIKGRVYLDNNNNGVRDAGDELLKNVIVETSGNNTTISNVTNANGEFLNAVVAGTYTTVAKHGKPYYASTPASKQSVFTTYNNTDSFDFALAPMPNKNDLELMLQSIGRIRPGFSGQYRIDYRNVGTTAITGVQVKLVKPSVMTFISALPAQASVVADTITWNLSDLAVAASGFIILKIEAAQPPTVNIGDLLVFTATILPVQGDEVPGDNADTLRQTVTGSFDPNDKLDNNGGFLIPEQAAAGKPLTYTIRFQNTGTDTAFNVIIRDTLEADLDWSSFQMISSSHNHNLAIKNGKMLTWTFSDILLPDSNVNEPASHGYVSFRIKPLQPFEIGDTITNTASIYFDFNPPVRTNVNTVVVKPAPPAQPTLTGIQPNYCSTVGVQTGKITNLPASGSGITVTVKIDGTTVAVGADSTFSFNVGTLSAGTHSITVEFSNSTANRIASSDFTITAAVTPDVNVSANIITITNLVTPVIVTGVNATGGGTTPLYTFARDRNFTNITQPESANNTWTFDPSILAIGDNKIYIRMKSNASCVVVNTAVDSILLQRSSVTGIVDPELPGQVINIYPNPFKDAISINGLSTSKTYTITLYNLHGQSLASKRVNNQAFMTLDRQHLATGIYWLSIFDEKRKKLLGTVRLLKE